MNRSPWALSPIAFAISLAALSLAGCGASRPIKYYQLTYPSLAPTNQAPLNVSILVRSFDAVHLYREDRIVYGFNAQEVGTYELSRWIAPPVDLLQSALVRGLRSTGQFHTVLTVRGEGGGDFALTGYLYEFGEVDSPAVVARLHYVARLRDRKTGEIVWMHTYNRDEPATEKSIPAIAAAMDKNVQTSVQEISASLGEYFQAHPPK
jgi:ABC-type uncharacterized transport system auxiliary subunit